MVQLLQMNMKSFQSNKKLNDINANYIMNKQLNDKDNIINLINSKKSFSNTSRDRERRMPMFTMYENYISKDVHKKKFRKIIKKMIPLQQDQFADKNKTIVQPFYIVFLNNFYNLCKYKRSFRLIIPEICVFRQGSPIYLLSKRKDYLPIKMIHSKGRLNFYEIKNFFSQGYLFHNKESIAPTEKLKINSFRIREDDVRKKQKIKNQCFIIARFINNTGQLLTPDQMNHLFRTNQLRFRLNLLYLQTVVNSDNYQQISIKIKIESFVGTNIYNRAKNEARIIMDDVKTREATHFVQQIHERQFEDKLKKENKKTFLQYISIKMILIHSYKTKKLIQDGIFKYAENNGSFYLVDVVCNILSDYKKVWGLIINQIQKSLDVKLENVLKLKDQIEDKYKHLENSPNTLKLQNIMNIGYQFQKDNSIGNRIQELENLRKQKKLILAQTSLPLISKRETNLQFPQKSKRTPRRQRTSFVK